MKGKTWFGTRGRETWIPTFAINPDYGRSGYMTRSDYINGGAGVRDSKNAHNTYVISWQPTKSREAIRLITDFADGVYDDIDGVNLIYWLDKMALDANVLQQAMATPALAAEDAPSLITDANGYGSPKAVATPANTLRYPARSAQYTQEPDSVTYEQYIPISPGDSLWLGVHGDANANNRMVAQRVNGYVEVGSPLPLPVLSVTSTTRVNTEFSSADSTGVVIKFASVVSTQVYTLSGIIAQILPIGQAPTIGGFISGQGHSGCQFVGKPAKTPYSARMDRVGATARLEETGMYL